MADMTAPDKIWLAIDAMHIGAWTVDELQRVEGDVAYTRDDIVDALRTELAATRMREVALLNGNQEDRDTLRRILAIHDAQLAEARAQTAAAYEVAAKISDRFAKGELVSEVSLNGVPVRRISPAMHAHAVQTAGIYVSENIRALTPADAKAALDKMLADARAAALREAAHFVETHAYTTGPHGRSLIPVIPKLADMDHHHATIASAIRAMIGDAND